MGVKAALLDDRILVTYGGHIYNAFTGYFVALDLQDPDATWTVVSGGYDIPSMDKSPKGRIDHAVAVLHNSLVLICAVYVTHTQLHPCAYLAIQINKDTFFFFAFFGISFVSI